MIAISLRKIWHLVGTATSFAFFGIWGVCLAWIVLPIVHHRCPGSDRDKAMACRRWVSASLCFLFRFMCRRGIFDFSAPPSSADLPQDKRFVLIANHPSLVDMVALLACFPELVVVTKTTMFNNPLLGPIPRRCAFIDGGDGSAFSGAAVVTAAVERLREGTPILIFPEGTRSGWAGLGTFRQGAFEMAIRAGVPLLPAYITTQPRTLMKGMPWYRIPVERVTFRVELGEPIHVAPGERARQMAMRVQALYDQQLAERGMIQSPQGREGAGDGAQTSGLLSPSTQNGASSEMTDADSQPQAEVSAA